jgi:predicted MFS family arabinose efflux permease
MAWPVELAALSQRVPGRALASAYGLRIAAWNLSWAAISIVAGQLIVHGGYNAPLYILAAATALGIAALWWSLSAGRDGPPRRQERQGDAKKDERSAI